MEEVYVEQPQGFEIEGKEVQIYKLNKDLFGLKQALRAWYNNIDQHVLECGFIRSEREPTLYARRSMDGNFIMLGIYVDDMIYVGSFASMVDEFKSQMMKKIEMTDRGLLQ